MALQPAAELPVGIDEFVLADYPDRPVHRIQQRRGMALGKNQVVIGRQRRLVPVIAEVPLEQDRHEIRSRQR
jgi:hypothetical protein